MSDSKFTPRDMEIVSKAFQCFVTPDAMKIDSEKLAGLAGFANGKSANASWLLVKKKLMSGATADAATTTSTPKKSKGKAAANGDGDNVEEASPTVAASKKRGKAVKTEPADTEGGDADNEKTPTAETPKKSRAKKTTAAASKIDVTGDATNDTAATAVVTPTPKRKRGPNKPKDPNATPTKRAKKGAKAGITTTEPNDDNTANAHLVGMSTFAGDAKVKNEDEGDNRPLNAEEQGMADEAMPDTYAEGQVA